MESIELNEIIKKGKTIEYKFSFTSGFSKIITNQRFIIHYPVDVSNVPDSILAVPFVSNFIQVIWLTNSSLIVPTIDKDFFNCLPELKLAFVKMFPDVEFKGQFICEDLKETCVCNNDKSAMFYSGGVDSVQTLISHCEEDIDLITVWGSDINYDNEVGWSILEQSMKESIAPFNKKLLVIHSSFRKIIDEDYLDSLFSKKLKDSWWHGIRHGLGLLGHVAPLAHLNGYKSFYIASTHSTHDKNVRCSSHPSTDNCVKFSGCQVFHDGFEYNRQAKIRNIVKFASVYPDLSPQLHVCWKSQTGKNCCLCEKCARTIYAILIENGNPKQFGFDSFEMTLSKFSYKECLLYLNKHNHLIHAWVDIANQAIEKKATLREHLYWKQIKWLTKITKNKILTFKSKPNKIRVFIAKCFRKIQSLMRVHSYKKMWIKNVNDRTVFLLGTPTHCNIGDAAIAQAEIDFIKDAGFNVFEISVNEWKQYKGTIRKKIKSNVILLHGGGNFGDIWPYEEEAREDIISSLKGKKFLMFPQTFYLKEKEPSKELDRLQEIYNHENFYLFARERFSYEKLRLFLPKANVYLVPDIVLYEKGNNFLNSLTISKSDKVLLVLRNDRESIYGYDEKRDIKNILETKCLPYTISDMIYDGDNISKENRFNIISDKIKEFANSKFIITDRLHGMIFAYLVNKPCIILKNNNYKINGVFEWIKESQNLFFIENLSDLPLAINKALCCDEFKQFDKTTFNVLRNQLITELKRGNN